jgi:hypothetical protein
MYNQIHPPEQVIATGDARYDDDTILSDGQAQGRVERARDVRAPVGRCAGIFLIPAMSAARPAATRGPGGANGDGPLAVVGLFANTMRRG